MPALICSHNPRKKTRVAVLSAGHKHPVLPSRKFLSTIVMPLSRAMAAGRGRWAVAEGGRGRKFSCIKQMSELWPVTLSLSFPTLPLPSLGMAGQHGTFSDPWDHGENRTSDHTGEHGHPQGKQSSLQFGVEMGSSGHE